MFMDQPLNGRLAHGILTAKQTQRSEWNSALVG
jgi:hypothetical protein